jgi:hypothetical protein
MKQALRFLAWLSIALAIGVQVSGLGSLGYSLCVERSGGVCAIEAPGQACCANDDAGDVHEDDGLAVDHCDFCTDTSLALPASTAPASSAHWNHDRADLALPTLLPWFTARQPLMTHPTARTDRSRAPPISPSLQFARIIVLRV